MAQKKKKSSHASKAASEKKKAESKNIRPIRREIWGGVCLVLAIVALLSCFGVDSFLTNLIANLSLGLFGAGFYVLPFVLVWAFVILAFHDGRPVRLRLFCTFALVAAIGAVVHVFACKEPPAWGLYSMLRDLYLGGVSGSTGGAISGLIGMLLAWAVSKLGAAAFLIVAIIFALLTSLNMTIPGIIRAIRQRPRAEYEAPKTEHPDPAEVIVNHVAQRHMEQTQKRRARVSDFDIPVDDPVAPVHVEKPAPVKKTAAGVKSPDQLIMEQQASEGIITPQKDVPAQDVPAEISPEVRSVLESEPQKVKKEEVQRETILVAQEIEENITEEAPKYI